MKSTIKSNADISLLFSQGQKINTPFVTILIMKWSNQHDHEQIHGRAAFIAGKKLGCAVWRNGAKRRMRAIVTDLGGPWEGYDIAFIARASILKAPYAKVSAECKKALLQFGINDVLS